MKNALIVIDVQNAFIDERTKHIPVEIAKHIQIGNYDFVLFTQFINSPDSNFFKQIGWKACMNEPEINIAKELEPFVTKENLFQKTTYSAMKAKGLLKFLQAHDMGSVYLCGLDADSCVLATAFEAFDLGFKVKVLTELIACGNKDELYEFTKEVLENNIQKPL